MSKHQHSMAFLFLLLIGVLTFSNSLHSPFLIDDHGFFSTKPDLRTIFDYFIPDKNAVLGIESKGTDLAYYRPLAHVIPALCYAAFGSNTTGFHTVNLILFIIAAFLFYRLIVYVFEDYILALLSAVFYLVHPINGLVVNYITASVFAAQVIFMLASLWFSLRVTLGMSLRGLFFKAVAIFFFALALMCHETAIMLPLYAFILTMVFHRENVKKSLRRVWPLFIFAIVYFFLRLIFVSLKTSVFYNLSHVHVGVLDYAGSVSKLILWYIGKFFYPEGITLMWACAPLKELEAIGWCLALVGLIWGLAWYMIRHKTNRAGILGLLWLFLGFLPLILSSGISPLQGFIIEPHWFVFSSLGAFLFLASIFVSLRRSIIASEAKQSLFLSLLLIIPWILISRQYNNLWSNEITYCQYWLSQAPDFKTPVFFLGLAYDEEKDYTKARYYYQHSLLNRQKDWMVYLNLAGLDLKEGKLDEAQADFVRVLQHEPRLSKAYDGLGSIYMIKNDLPHAQQLFEQAIVLDRFALSPRMKLAVLLEKQGNIPGVIKMYRSILQIYPHDEMVLILLLKIYYEDKDRDHTIEIARELAAYSHRKLTQYNVGIIFRGLGLKDEADRAFERAARE